MSSAKRDLTKDQFLGKCKQYGIRPAMMGYYSVTDKCSVYARNGGPTYRAQLAYLLAAQAKEMEASNA